MQCSPQDTVLPAPQLDTADQLVSIDFRRGIDRPQWAMVKSAYAQDAPFLAVAPVFTAANNISYSLRIELQDADFVGAAGEQPLFDRFSGNPFVTPIEVGTLDTGRNVVDVRWTAPRLDKEWQRWVFRFYVEQEGGTPQPFPLAFVYLPPDGPEALAAAATPTNDPTTHDPTSDDVTNPNTDVPTLSTIIQVNQGLPVYPDVFDYERVTLPPGVYPDPLVNVLKSDEPFLLEFTSSRGTFSPSTITPCNRGGDDDTAPLALTFLGVSDPNPQCQPQLVPRGFDNSAVARSLRQCVVAWREPNDGSSVASFLFSDTDGRSQSMALLDPTVINDLPENPPG